MNTFYAYSFRDCNAVLGNETGKLIRHSREAFSRLVVYPLEQYFAMFFLLLQNGPDAAGTSMAQMLDGQDRASIGQVATLVFKRQRFPVTDTVIAKGQTLKRKSVDTRGNTERSTTAQANFGIVIPSAPGTKQRRILQDVITAGSVPTVDRTRFMHQASCKVVDVQVENLKGRLVNKSLGVDNLLVRIVMGVQLLIGLQRLLCLVRRFLQPFSSYLEPFQCLAQRRWCLYDLGVVVVIQLALLVDTFSLLRCTGALGHGCLKK